MKVLAASKTAALPGAGTVLMSPKAASDLKVALLAAPFIPVPPKGYGGLERIVYDLAIGLSKLGVKVTVFGADESEVPGCEVVRFGPAIGTTQVDWLKAEMDRFQRIKDKLAGFDIIHSHDWFGLAYRLRRDNAAVRICHTHHGHINAQWWKSSPAPFPTNIFGISKWMASLYKQLGIEARAVYNGIDLDKYAFQEQKGDRLIFVGRADSFKQPHVAVAVAKKLGLGIDMVCGTFVQDTNYLEYVKGLCDGEQVRWVEDPPQDVKVRLMQNAKCLLFPSKMGEPFGLVAAEAMACGTPVVALNDGAIAEVVEDAKTGFVVADHTVMPPDQWEKLPDSEKRDREQRTLDGLCEAVKNVMDFGPMVYEQCRARAGLFSKENMAANYLAAYREIINGGEW